MLIKPLLTKYTPAVHGHPAVPPATICPDPAPPNNGGGGGSSGGGSNTLCFIVPNQYGGTMQVCVG